MTREEWIYIDWKVTLRFSHTADIISRIRFQINARGNSYPSIEMAESAE